jgi:hypothetical protein
MWYPSCVGNTYHILPLEVAVHHLVVVNLTEPVVRILGEPASIASVLHMGTTYAMGSHDGYNLVELEFATFESSVEIYFAIEGKFGSGASCLKIVND